jgi:hypothetical protein
VVLEYGDLFGYIRKCKGNVLIYMEIWEFWGWIEEFLLRFKDCMKMSLVRE